jgi:hypothetical protein
MMDLGWIKRIADLVEALLPKDFVGQFEINVFKGSITSVNVRLSYRSDERPKP